MTSCIIYIDVQNVNLDYIIVYRVLHVYMFKKSCNSTNGDHRMLSGIVQ